MERVKLEEKLEKTMVTVLMARRMMLEKAKGGQEKGREERSSSSSNILPATILVYLCTEHSLWAIGMHAKSLGTSVPANQNC